MYILYTINLGCICDVVRCSVTFNSCKELLTELNQFIANVDSGKMGCIKRVLRVKNMFCNCFDSNIPAAAMDLDKFSYCDIKINVVVEHAGKQIICEIQFLLEWMLKGIYIILTLVSGIDFLYIIYYLYSKDSITCIVHDFEKTRFYE